MTGVHLADGAGPCATGTEELAQSGNKVKLLADKSKSKTARNAEQPLDQIASGKCFEFKTANGNGKVLV